MGDPAADVTPSELKFRFQLNKQLPAAISIYNPSNERQAFKVKTTTPKKYVVRPSSGVVEPKSTANVQVIMQVQKEFPADFANCKDKFLVQVKCLEPSEEITQDTFKSPKGVKATADAASLSQENRALKAQLERMMAERDTLRGKELPIISKMMGKD
eukprot:gene9699-9858_t